MRTYQVRAKEGQTINYTASASGYVSQPGSVIVSASTAASPIIINLSESVNFYPVNIVPNISGCTVILNGEERTSGYFAEGTRIYYTVSHPDYVDETDDPNEPIYVDGPLTINVTMSTSIYARLTVNVYGWDNVNNTTTDITSSSTISFRVNGTDTPGTGHNYIDVTPGDTVGYKASCSDYVESGWTYITVNRDTPPKTITLEKSTNQYTLTWVLTDPEGQTATGYTLTVRVNGGSPQTVVNNTFTGTIEDVINWSATKTGTWSPLGGNITLMDDQLIERQFSAATYIWIEDTQNNRISGVDVTFTDNVTGTSYSSTTGSNGIAYLDDTVSGHTYTISGTKTGYHPVSGVVQAGGNVGLTMYATSELVRFTINPDPSDNDTHVYMNTTNSFTSADEVFVIEQAGIYSCYGRNDIVPDGTTWYYKVTHPGYDDYYGSYVINRNIVCLIAQMVQSQSTLRFFEPAGFSSFDLYIMENGSWVKQYPSNQNYSNYYYVVSRGSTVQYKAETEDLDGESGHWTISGTVLANALNIEVRLEIENWSSNTLSDQYLTMELTDPTDELYFRSNGDISRTIQYSTDGTNWTSFTSTSSAAKIPINANTPVYFKASATQFSTGSSAYTLFQNKNYGTSTVLVYGKVSSLFGSHASTGTQYRLYKFFKYLDVANKYIAGTLVNIDMSGISMLGTFNGSGTTGGSYSESYACYQMFEGCTHLTAMPALPATDVGGYCYAYMFNGCTSLTTVSSLPASTTVSASNGSHYYNREACYRSMFRGCTSLTTSPSIRATTFGNADSMFYGCSSLNKIYCQLASSISATLNSWVDGVAASGTFYKKSTMTDWPSGVNGIPTGWTVQNVS